MGYRFFIFEADGTMRHIPQRIANGIHLGDPPLPEYAGSKLRYALVFLATDNRRPMEITRIEGGYFSFDKRGNPQQELARGGIEALDTWDDLEEEKAQTGQVVTVTARLARKKWEQEHRWTPTRAEVNAMCDVIWPKKTMKRRPKPGNRPE